MITQITQYQVIYRQSNIIAILSLVLLAPILKNDSVRFIICVQPIITFAYYLFFEYQIIDFKFVL